MSNRERETVQDKFIGFRMAKVLVRASEEKAAQRGMAMSEYLRDLVRRDVLVD